MRIGAINGADDHLIDWLKDGNGIRNRLCELTKAREAAEAQELAELLNAFEIEPPDEDGTGNVSDLEVVEWWTTNQCHRVKRIPRRKTKTTT
ncbi:hypothetical protein AAVH_11175 [Aphelenchoides avenae]|nr:hypothetical protein AAVH_11175 [Aphelenchus avenae]